MEQRTKEIGVRKILGASVTNLWQLLSGDFLILVTISCLPATPIAWYIMDRRLGKYTYHVQISWWIFAVAASATLFITLITVSYQAVRTALMDPVRSLRGD